MVSAISGRPFEPAGDLDIPAEKTVCITGHRETRVKPYGGLAIYLPMTVAAVKLVLRKYIDSAIDRGYQWFESGLATGTDLWAAEHVIARKRSGADVKLLGVAPYRGHADYFPENVKTRLAEVEKNCDALVCVNPDPAAHYDKGYGRNVYRDRNYFMVDRASAVIAFLSPETGRSGTEQTVAYARRRGRTVRSFGLEDVYAAFDSAGADIREISREIDSWENVFDLPF